MTQFFFSVDVETSSTNPFTGELLTVGIVPINADNLEILPGRHWALEYDKDNCDPKTVEWWKEQNQVAYEAAWEGERLPTETAAAQIRNYVCSFSEVLHDRVFAANPASFDWAWMEKLFAFSEYDTPFSHRTLCMRNVLYGLTGGVWGNSRYKEVLVNYPDIPHHALSDAESQAKDLVNILGHLDPWNKGIHTALDELQKNREQRNTMINELKETNELSAPLLSRVLDENI